MRKTPIDLADKSITDAETQERSPLQVVYPVIQTPAMMEDEAVTRAMDLIKDSGAKLEYDDIKALRKCEFHTPLLTEPFVAMSPDQIKDKDGYIVFAVDSSITTNVFTTALIVRTNNGELCFSRIFNDVPYDFDSTGIRWTRSDLYELEGVEKALVEGIRLGYHKFNVLLVNDCKHALEMYYNKERVWKQGLSIEKNASDKLETVFQKLMLRIDENVKHYNSITIGRVPKLKKAVDELSKYGTCKLAWKWKMYSEWLIKEEKKFPLTPSEVLDGVFKQEPKKGGQVKMN